MIILNSNDDNYNPMLSFPLTLGPSKRRDTVRLEKCVLLLNAKPGLVSLHLLENLGSNITGVTLKDKGRRETI